MKSNIQAILNLNKFFKVTNFSINNMTYRLENPSSMLIQNIKQSWVKSLFAKTQKHFKVYINKDMQDLEKKSVPFGLMTLNVTNYSETELNQSLTNYCPDVKTELKFSMFLHRRDLMPNFIQWQRYRKYWWSCITTTPSLFSINDIRNGDGKADVDVTAQFSFGPQPVETVSFTINEQENNKAMLSCSISLERALITLLLDSYNANEDYLRIHRKMAPYKIALAVNSNDMEKRKTLKELAILLNHKLEEKQIPVWRPDHDLAIDKQLKDGLQIGVPYTAILDENVLVNGIFNLLNSSTMLKEQVHIADFHSYAELLFEN